MNPKEAENFFISAERDLKSLTLAVCPEDLTPEQLAAAQGGQNGKLQKEEEKDWRD